MLCGSESGDRGANTQQMKPCDLVSGIKTLVWTAHSLVVIQAAPSGVKFRSSPWRSTSTAPSVRILSFSISGFHFRKPDVSYAHSLDLLLKQFLKIVYNVRYQVKLSFYWCVLNNNIEVGKQNTSMLWWLEDWHHSAIHSLRNTCQSVFNLSR